MELHAEEAVASYRRAHPIGGGTLIRRVHDVGVSEVERLSPFGDPSPTEARYGQRREALDRADEQPEGVDTTVFLTAVHR